MKYLDLTFETPEENLACDEALLEACEKDPKNEILRFWESKSHFVVLGYSNKSKLEANLTACEKLNIPVLRRPSGGGAVLQGPGCLNYSLILLIKNNHELSTIAQTNRYIMENNRQALEQILGKPVSVRGITDLAIGDLKFSGNSQRRKSQAILFHGTFLYAMDISLVEQTLRFPSKVPCYREGRTHKDFVINLKIEPGEIKEALKKQWNAQRQMTEWPAEITQELLTTKYRDKAWNLKF